MEQVRALYDLKVLLLSPLVEQDDRWSAEAASCCRARKMEPLRLHLRGKTAWASGIRHSEAARRTAAPVVFYDLENRIIKINPLIRWSDEDVVEYVRQRRLPVHLLFEQGCRSAGCLPCTRAIEAEEQPRAGRWPGLHITECGLHG